MKKTFSLILFFFLLLVACGAKQPEAAEPSAAVNRTGAAVIAAPAEIRALETDAAVSVTRAADGGTIRLREDPEEETQAAAEEAGEPETEAAETEPAETETSESGPEKTEALETDAAEEEAPETVFETQALKDEEIRNGAEEQKAVRTRIPGIEIYESGRGLSSALYADSRKYPGLSEFFDLWNDYADRIEGDIFIQRADERYVSFLWHSGTASQSAGDGTYFAGYEWKIGVNIDTQTGDFLKLDDIIADRNGFRTELERQIFDLVDEEQHGERVRGLLDKLLAQPDILSSDDLSFTVGAEGLNVYLHTVHNFDFFAGRDRPAAHFYIAYEQHPELFVPELLEIPESYVQQLVFKEGFSEHIMTGTGEDGEAEEIILEPEYEDGEYRGFWLFGGNSAKFALQPASERPVVWFVKLADWGPFLYVQQDLGTGEHVFSSYSLDGEPKCASMIKGLDLCVERRFPGRSGSEAAAEGNIADAEITARRRSFDPEELSIG